MTVTILLTLAIGMGANTAIFTVDYATPLALLPYPQPDQLVMVQIIRLGVQRLDRDA